jgi:pimeloyl-ACP methyl ester carboxylesterase
LHYLEDGDGEVVVLLHGWPHTSHGWRHVIPRLSQKYRVIAPDLRGIGDSFRTATGFDNATVGADIVELMDSLGVRKFSLVGHDWGGPVAFAATLLARDRVQKLALVDTVLAGDGRTAGSGQGGARWHHLFHCTPDLPEALTAGREAIYLSWFYDEYSVRAGAVHPDDLAEYVRCYSQLGAIHAQRLRILSDA